MAIETTYRSQIHIPTYRAGFSTALKFGPATLLFGDGKQKFQNITALESSPFSIFQLF